MAKHIFHTSRRPKFWSHAWKCVHVLFALRAPASVEKSNVGGGRGCFHVYTAWIRDVHQISSPFNGKTIVPKVLQR